MALYSALIWLSETTKYLIVTNSIILNLLLVIIFKRGNQGWPGSDGAPGSFIIIIIIKIETTLQPEAELRGLHIVTCTTYKYIINTIL